MTGRRKLIAFFVFAALLVLAQWQGFLTETLAVTLRDGYYALVVGNVGEHASHTVSEWWKSRKPKEA